MKLSLNGATTMKADLAADIRAASPITRPSRRARWRARPTAKGWKVIA
ncbi:MAG TPA: hypothetical protein VNO70_22225 [Blastocatellia bacterium]|nr:hypothetical protein [Blastocatellia bacterium]